MNSFLKHTLLNVICSSSKTIVTLKLHRIPPISEVRFCKWVILVWLKLLSLSTRKKILKLVFWLLRMTKWLCALYWQIKTNQPTPTVTPMNIHRNTQEIMLRVLNTCTWYQRFNMFNSPVSSAVRQIKKIYHTDTKYIVHISILALHIEESHFAVKLSV